MSDATSDLGNTLARFERATTRYVKTTQTTYLDLGIGFGTSEEEIYRIHFDGKQEFYLERKNVKKISVEKSHPLLIDYVEEIVDVHLEGIVERKSEFAGALESTAFDIFGTWREYDHYLNVPLEQFLKLPYGLLLSAPRSFADKVVELGPNFGVNLYIRNEREPRGEFEALLMDDLYVVSKGFRIEPMSGR